MGNGGGDADNYSAESASEKIFSPAPSPLALRRENGGRFLLVCHFHRNPEFQSPVYAAHYVRMGEKHLQFIRAGRQFAVA